jgi:hypothetical protein
MRQFDLIIVAAIILGVAVLIGTVVLLGVRARKKRTAALQLVAESLGLPFHAAGDCSIIQELSAFQLFSRGRSKRITNLIRAETEDIGTAIFDYQYTIGSGKSKQTIHQTVVSLQAIDLALPDFSLRPETLLHKIGGWFGYADIDFADHPVFSGAFLLRGPNEQSIRRLFMPSVLEYFEQRKGLYVEARGARFICYRPRKRVTPAEVQAWLNNGWTLLQLFRASVSSAALNNERIV